MAFEIVDGATGTKHISSEDLACLNESVLGMKDCCFHWGDDFALTVVDNNHVTIGTGSGMVGARRFWNKAPVDLTISSGAQDRNRNDLVVARYAVTGDGVESVNVVVLEGEPTTGTAEDPATTSNDVPLWRVPIAGITIGAPVSLRGFYALPVGKGGTGASTAPQALANIGAAASSHTHSGYLSTAGGTLDGYLVFDEKGGETGIAVTNDGEYRISAIKVVHADDNGYGDGLIIGACGTTIIGAGESVNAIAADIPELSSEHMYVGADQNIHFWTNCQSGLGSGSHCYLTKKAVGELLPWQQIYPVGAVYISYESTSPASLFGGKWTAITGRFPYFNAGTATGGSNTQTLTVAQLPSHTHNTSLWHNNGSGGTENYGLTYSDWNGVRGGAWYDHASKATGSGSAHNNMPAYQTLYAWRRTE